MSIISFLCPHCSQPLSAESIYAGQKVICAHCKQEIQIPEQEAASQKNMTPPVELTAVPMETPSHATAKSRINIFKIAIIAIAILQLATFILLFHKQITSTPSPSFYQYKVFSFNRYDKDSFDTKINELANDGWEYCFEIFNLRETHDIVFRKPKNSYDKVVPENWTGEQEKLPSPPTRPSKKKNSIMSH